MRVRVRVRTLPFMARPAAEAMLEILDLLTFSFFPCPGLTASPDIVVGLFFLLAPYFPEAIMWSPSKVP